MNKDQNSVPCVANMANDRGRRGGRAGAKSGKAGGRGIAVVFIKVAGTAEGRGDRAIPQWISRPFGGRHSLSEYDTAAVAAEQRCCVVNNRVARSAQEL